MKSEKYSFEKITAQDSGIWYDYLKEKKEATIFHHPLWLKTLEHETNQETYYLICLDENQKVVGGIPLQQTRGMYAGIGGIITQKRLASLPRTPLMDVLADNNTIIELLILRAVEINKAERGSIFQLKCINVQNYLNIKDIIKVPWRDEYYLTFPKDDSELRFGEGENHRKIKWAVNKARKNGIKIKKGCTYEELETWYKLYLATCRWHAALPRPFKFFEFLYRELYPSGLMKMYLAVIKDTEGGREKIITGSVFLSFNKSVYYSFNGRDAKYLKFRPNDLIQWEAIHDAYKEGYLRYHFGEVSEGQDGLAEFKKKWCNEKKQIFHLYSGDNLIDNINLNSSYSGNFKRKIWKKVPLHLTEKIGNIIYHRL